MWRSTAWSAWEKDVASVKAQWQKGQVRVASNLPQRGVGKQSRLTCRGLLSLKMMMERGELRVGSNLVGVSTCVLYAYVYSTCNSTSFLFHINIQLLHIHMYIRDDYCAMISYDRSIPITIILCVPAEKGFARCLHTRNPMSKGRYFNTHTCLCFL